MKNYIIVTDSCCDLPKEYIINNNIPFVSLPYTFMGKNYMDDFGDSLNYKDFYEGMKNGEMPDTSQANPESYFRLFKKILDKDKNTSIIYICLSSGLSGSYNSANIAKIMILEQYPEANLEIIDCLTSSLGQGLLVIKSLEMQKNGATLGEIVQYLNDAKYRLNTYITVDDLGHLKRGGRISSTAAALGIVLHLKPILTLTDEGKVIPILKAKGRKNAFNKLVSILCEKIINPEDQTIMICHGDTITEAEKLKELILKNVKVKDIIINHIGPVVGRFGGPGAIGLFFMGNYRQNHVVDVNI